MAIPRGAAGAGDADGMGGGAPEYGACTDLAPVEPAPELTGRWALRTVASWYVPETGLMSAFNTRTVSVLLADVAQTGTHVSLAAQYCEQHAQDPEAAAHIVIPESYAKSLETVVRTGTYAEGDAGQRSSSCRASSKSWAPRSPIRLLMRCRWTPASRR